MPFKFLVVASLVLFGLVSASSGTDHRTNSSLFKRFNTLTGQWDTESESNGYYTLYNNLWGKSSASSGSQSTQATAVNGIKVSWKTTYTWTGGPGQVKSYANLGLNSGLNKKLSAIQSIQTGWFWTYSSASSDLVANVAFDLWLSASSGGSHTDEIMIWLSSRGGAGPAGSQIATVTINGQSWKLFRGTVSNWTVWSFVAAKEITNWSSDLKPFFNYLTGSQGVSTSKYLTGVQAGTEPFSGSATLSTTEYSVTVN